MSKFIAKSVNNSAVALDPTYGVLDDHAKRGDNVIVRPLEIGERAFLRAAFWYAGVWMDMLDALKGRIAEKANVLRYPLSERHLVEQPFIMPPSRFRGTYE